MENFNSFFNHKIKKTLEQYSEKRDFARMLFGLSVLFLLFSSIVPIFLSDYLSEHIISFFRILMILSIPLLLIAHFVMKKASNELRREIMPKLVKVIHPTLTFSYEEYIPKEDFMNAKLLDKGKIYRYSGKELVKGTIEKHAVSFSNVTIKQYNKKRNENRVAFQGVVYSFDLGNSFYGTTTVLPYKMKTFTFIGGLKKVKDFRFTQNGLPKKYIVYSDHPKSTNMILSYDIMNKIQHFVENQPRPVRFSFHDGNLLIAIERKNHPLEFRIEHELEKENLKKYAEEIQDILNFAMKLKEGSSYEKN